MKKYIISSPVGGFGNHLRWLLLISVDKSYYKMIKEQVYVESRNYSNWLQYEWKFRHIVNPIIYFSHNLKNVSDIDNESKVLILTTEPEFALKIYFKFNPLLNGPGLAIDYFFDQVTVENLGNTDSIILKQKHNFIIKSEKLYTNNLNYDLYKQIISFYDYSDCYKMANEIHNLWFTLHKKAEIDVLRTLNSWEYTDIIPYPSEKQFEFIKTTIKKLYGENN